MNFSSLLPKASFAVLLLIFGCLVYIIVRDHRLEQARASQQAKEEEERQAAAAASATNELQTIRERRDEYAPLRPRAVSPSSAQPPRNAPALPPSPPVVVPVERVVAVEAAPVEPPVDYAAFAGTRTVSGALPGGNTRLGGVVLLRGTPPSEVQITLDPACGRLHTKPLMTRHYVVGETGGLANVFVYVKSGAVSVGPPIAKSVLLDQTGCEFQPYVLGVQVGQPLLVRNSDPLMHNPHATPTQNRDRSVTQRVRGMTSPFLFQRPEVLVRFKCDVHPWMFAYVGVVDHPWFAVTDANGTFTLPAGLTPGRYTVAAVHPKAGELTQDIRIEGTSVEPINFVFEIPDRPARPSGSLTQAALR